MYFQGIKCVFFDIGSTLADERLAYAHRIREMTAGSAVSYKQFYLKMLDFYARNYVGDAAAAAYFGLRRTPWHSEDEFLYPDSLPTLKKLSSVYRLGIIANQTSGTVERLCAWGIRDFFDLVLSSAEEGVAKPDLEIFRRALERARCAPEQAVMIGDRPDNDIAPAKAIGMKTIRVRQGYTQLMFSTGAADTPDVYAGSLAETGSLLL